MSLMAVDGGNETQNIRNTGNEQETNMTKVSNIEQPFRSTWGIHYRPFVFTAE